MDSHCDHSLPSKSGTVSASSPLTALHLFGMAAERGFSQYPSDGEEYQSSAEEEQAPQQLNPPTPMGPGGRGDGKGRPPRRATIGGSGERGVADRVQEIEATLKTLRE